MKGFVYMLNASELRRREVINARTAERIGFISDIEIDYETGKILSIIVPENKNLMSIIKKKEYVIPWENIVAIGKDVILVRIEKNFLFPKE